MGWILDTSIPDIYTEDTVQDNLHTCFESPYPSIYWYVSQTNDDVMHMGELSYISPCFTFPFPNVFWYVEFSPPYPEDDVKYSGEHAYTVMGAFARTKNLEEVVLPSSLVSIGPYSFSGSGLSKVTIPNPQTTYYSTSFPPSCEVTGGHLIDD